VTGLRPFVTTKAPVSGAAVNAEAVSLSKRPTRPQANDDDDRIVGGVRTHLLGGSCSRLLKR
jgi:hypothetical protein